MWNTDCQNVKIFLQYHQRVNDNAAKSFHIIILMVFNKNILKSGAFRFFSKTVLFAYARLLKRIMSRKCDVRNTECI